MKIGAIVPQGWTGEYDGRDALDAWRRTSQVARQADRLGFESIWLFDHFHTVPRPTDEITFESFTSLAALAALTDRVRLGHIVTCTAFRNPALTAKMISTMDSISGGREGVWVGGGWEEEEGRGRRAWLSPRPPGRRGPRRPPPKQTRRRGAGPRPPRPRRGA